MASCQADDGHVFSADGSPRHLDEGETACCLCGDVIVRRVEGRLHMSMSEQATRRLAYLGETYPGFQGLL